MAETAAAQSQPIPPPVPLEAKTVQPTAPLPELHEGETIDTLLTPQAAPNDPLHVHLGSLRIERNVFDQFKEAERYLAKDPDAVKMLASLVHGPSTTTIAAIAKTDPDGDRFEPNGTFGTHPRQDGGTISWNPTGALRTTSGGTQTPALALLHEQGHALEWKTDAAGYLKGIREKTLRFTTAEEQRNERGPEERAAKILGEGTRENHLGHAYEVASPTSREPVPTPKIDYTPDHLKATVDAYAKFYNANGYGNVPRASGVEPWDHKQHIGSFMQIDDHTVVQHTGRGEYQMYDVAKDLGGKYPAELTPLTVDAKGVVHARENERERLQSR